MRTLVLLATVWVAVSVLAGLSWWAVAAGMHRTAVRHQRRATAGRSTAPRQQPEPGAPQAVMDGGAETPPDPAPAALRRQARALHVT